MFIGRIVQEALGTLRGKRVRFEANTHGPLGTEAVESNYDHDELRVTRRRWFTASAMTSSRSHNDERR